jgi:phage-related protein
VNDLKKEIEEKNTQIGSFKAEIEFTNAKIEDIKSNFQTVLNKEKKKSEKKIDALKQEFYEESNLMNNS